MALIVDSGPLYALRDEDDQYHRQCAEIALGHGEIVVPCSVLPEVSFHFEKNLGADQIQPLLNDLETGALRLEDIRPSDYSRIGELLDQYADLSLGFVDASIIAVAERLGIKSIFTIDRRDFSVVRPRHVDAFEILP